MLGSPYIARATGVLGTFSGSITGSGMPLVMAMALVMGMGSPKGFEEFVDSQKVSV